jgi:tRNA(fMet)-specific endonuclease VapC
MDFREELVARVEKLTPEMQERVLRFVVSLAATGQTGESGTALRHFSGSLDPVSAREMAQAIEEHCERVDVGEW